MFSREMFWTYGMIHGGRLCWKFIACIVHGRVVDIRGRCMCACTAIIMTPTRELAMQIGRECRKFTKALDLHVVCVYGGTGISEQIAELKRGAEVIVCTPGRMIDMLAANSGMIQTTSSCLAVCLSTGAICLFVFLTACLSVPLSPCLSVCRCLYLTYT